MHRLKLIVIALIAQEMCVHAQTPKIMLRVSLCEDLCANLIAAIQRQPGTLEMRLEDALVIHESCAPEIVGAAMYAVRAEPGKVNKILATALKLAPRRADAIRAAVAGYKSSNYAPVVREEIRRAELPAGQTLLKKDKAVIATQIEGVAEGTRIEIRRAELPDKTR
jgi:hypothetical protein